MIVDSPTLTVPLAVRDGLGLGVAPGEPPALAPGFHARPDLVDVRAQTSPEQRSALRRRWSVWWQASLDLLCLAPNSFAAERAWRSAARQHRETMSGEAPDFNALADAPLLREAAQAAAALNVWPLWPSAEQNQLGSDVVDWLAATGDRSDPRYRRRGSIMFYVLDVTGFHVRQLGAEVVLVSRDVVRDRSSAGRLLAAAVVGKAGEGADEALS